MLEPCSGDERSGAPKWGPFIVSTLETREDCGAGVHWEGPRRRAGEGLYLRLTFSLFFLSYLISFVSLHLVAVLQVPASRA